MLQGVIKVEKYAWLLRTFFAIVRPYYTKDIGGNKVTVKTSEGYVLMIKTSEKKSLCLSGDVLEARKIWVSNSNSLELYEKKTQIQQWIVINSTSTFVHNLFFLTSQIEYE